MASTTNINMENITLEGDLDATTKKEASGTNLDAKMKNANSGFGSGMFSSISMSSISSFDVNALKPQEWVLKRRETLKPWTEFASIAKFKKPTGAAQAGSRLIKNVTHFQSNYLFVFVFLAIYCVLTSPYLLIAFAVFSGGCYMIHLKHKDGVLKIMGKELNLAQLYCAAGLLSVPLFLIAGAGSAVFWIIGASIVVIVLHAVFYARDEQEDPFAMQMNVV